MSHSCFNLSHTLCIHVSMLQFRWTLLKISEVTSLRVVVTFDRGHWFLSVLLTLMPFTYYCLQLWSLLNIDKHLIRNPATSRRHTNILHVLFSFSLLHKASQLRNSGCSLMPDFALWQGNNVLARRATAGMCVNREGGSFKSVLVLSPCAKLFTCVSCPYINSYISWPPCQFQQHCVSTCSDK